MPCMSSRPAACTLNVLFMTSPEPAAAGLARVTAASGKLAVSRIFASCGCALPLTVTAVRPTRKDAEETSLWAMTAVPVTALVRPAIVLPGPRKSSRTRYPASDPFPAVQVPLTGALPRPAAAAARADPPGPGTRPAPLPPPSRSRCPGRCPAPPRPRSAPAGPAEPAQDQPGSGRKRTPRQKPAPQPSPGPPQPTAASDASRPPPPGPGESANAA